MVRFFDDQKSQYTTNERRILRRNVFLNNFRRIIFNRAKGRPDYKTSLKCSLNDVIMCSGRFLSVDVVTNLTVTAFVPSETLDCKAYPQTNDIYSRITASFSI